MSNLAFNGAKDFKGHKLCRQCWDQLPKLAPVKAEMTNKARIHRRIEAKHNCAGGKCECPCRLMEKEQIAKPKRDMTLQMEIPAGTITV